MFIDYRFLFPVGNYDSDDDILRRGGGYGRFIFMFVCIAKIKHFICRHAVEIAHQSIVK